MNVALIAFIDDKGKILLNRRADADSEMWEFIGGGIEKGETALSAIKREVSEEVHYTLDEDFDTLLHIETFDYETDKIDAKVHVFKATYPGIDKFSDSEETFIQDLKMFSFEDATGLTLLPMTRVILERDFLSLK